MQVDAPSPSVSQKPCNCFWRMMDWRKMKARAPPPPSQPLAVSQIQSEQKSLSELGVIPDQSLVTMKENLINRTVDFTVVLPSGVEQKNNVHGSKAVMDLLVDLCSRYHLNPAHHTLELKACGMEPLSYKPNTLVGALDVQTVLLKEKVPEGKTKRPPPRIPEKSVRLVVNYLKTHKAVVRVSPEVPLHSIIPAICEKCEVSPEHVVLLRDNITGEELELTKSLDELGIKELYAWDRKRETSQNSSISNDSTEKEKRGFLGFFKVNKRSNKGFATAPNSPSVNSRSITLGPSLSLGNISGMTANPEIKKRRAPPPPVATPHLQNTETSGNDLQKKKRRAPPPPTPPVPVMPNRTEEKEDKRRSTVESLQLVDDNIYVVDGMVLELSEVEETTSVSSCFASEDTTEDSGVVSSPSDVVSLDSQNDNMKLKDKPVNGQEDNTERDGTYAAELCSVRNTSWDSNDSGNAHQSRDEETTAAKNDNEDVFIVAGLQQTLAELDEDLEGRELCQLQKLQGMAKIYRVSFCPVHMQDSHGNTAQDAAFVVPVTIIDEILDINAVGNFTDNNSAGSFDKKHVDGGSQSISMDLIHQQSSDDVSKPLPVEQRQEMFESLTSSFEKRNENNLGLENTYKNGVSSEECKSIFLNKMKTELEFKPSSTKRTEEKEDILSPPLWGHRAPSSVTSYEPKVGLTTFKVVPPKPEIKYFERGNSFSTGAIKIDDLGNLMIPNADKKNMSDISSSETEEPLIGRIKEFWRSNSSGKQSDSSVEHNSKKPIVNVSAKPFNSKSESKPVSLTDPKPIPSQPVTSNMAERHLDLERIKPPVPATQSQVKTSVSPTITKDKTEFPFLKPYKRTSSHYVASAIAKRLDPLTFKTDLMEKPDKEENNREEKLIKTGTEPFPKGCIIMAKNSPMEIKPAETRDSYSNIFTCSHTTSNSRLTFGDNSAVKNKAMNIRLLNQTTPVGFYKRSISVPAKPSSKDNRTAEGDHSFNSKHSIVDKNTHPFSDQKCEKTDHTNSSSLFTSPDLPAPTSSSSSLLRPTKWHPLNITPVNNHVISQRDEKPDSINKSEVTVQTDIFGPKKKFKPIVQKPVPKDTSLHSTLMEAIQTAGGKEKLRKVKWRLHLGHGNWRKPKSSYAEPENEHSALLAAIRGHSGTSGLKKISSSASEELQSFRNAELSLQTKEACQAEQLWIPPPPVLPPPPPPPSHKSMTAPKFPVTATSNPGEAREALMEAIRSGAGAARLRKVNMLINNFSLFAETS
uniref:Cordon-bleu WH2 repeat protein n=1 Tax=Chelonoidis abingdonii TaxID=106734 RepID=A0A8C0GX34_CHEAB